MASSMDLASLRTKILTIASTLQRTGVAAREAADTALHRTMAKLCLDDIHIDQPFNTEEREVLLVDFDPATVIEDDYLIEVLINEFGLSEEEVKKQVLGSKAEQAYPTPISPAYHEDPFGDISTEKHVPYNPSLIDNLCAHLSSHPPSDACVKDDCGHACCKTWWKCRRPSKAPPSQRVTAQHDDQPTSNPASEVLQTQDADGNVTFWAPEYDDEGRMVNIHELSFTAAEFTAVSEELQKMSEDDVRQLAHNLG